MWDSENERLGVQACNKSAYNLRAIAELVGALSLYLLFFIIIFLAYRYFTDEYTNRLLFLILIPFFVGIVCEIIFQTALKKLSSVSYNFDPLTGVTTWIENNQKKSYIIKL